MGSALEDSLAFLLGDASDFGEHLALACGALELVEAVEYLLLGLVADAAGVVQNKSSGFGSLDLAVAAMNESPDDFLGIVRVHLAAEGLDVKRLVGHYVLIIGLSYFLFCAGSLGHSQAEQHFSTTRGYILLLRAGSNPGPESLRREGRGARLLRRKSSR